MQQQATRFFPDLDPRTGVLVLDGFGLKVFVRHGHLVLADGVGDERRERRLSRSARDVDRIVLLGHEGFITLEAIRWLDRVGIALVQLDADGHPLMRSALMGRDHAGLRRAQALLADSPVGVALARGLLVRKLTDQALVVREFTGEATSAAELEQRSREAEGAEDLDAILAAEAAGARIYWEALAVAPVRFPTRDLSKLPRQWLTVDGRRSPVTGRNRGAVNPANAILNYLYRLGEAESSLLLSALGLDPGMGIWHADTANRDSLALDVLEAARPRIDRHVLGLLASRTFRRADFHETADGICRIMPPLTHELAETMPMIRTWIAPIAEEVALAIGQAAARPVNVGAVSKRGRPGPRRRPAPCRVCGVQLLNVRRVVCDDCLPAYEAERTNKLSSAGKATIASMRASANDPAKSPDARAKRAARSREVMLANRAWERQFGRVFDVVRYETEVLPTIQKMSVSALAHATGLSSYYLWRVRKGERRLHPRHWESIS